jgi:hypothetical protein
MIGSGVLDEVSIRGALMTIQSDHNHHPTGQAMLLIAATVVLLVFALTYAH